MTLFFIFFLGLLAGAGIAYLYFRAELIREKTIVEQTGLSEQKIKDQFTLLAQDILNKNLESQVKALQNQNTNDLDKKKQEFSQSFEEIKGHLKSTGEKIQLFEKERTDQYAKTHSRNRAFKISAHHFPKRARTLGGIGFT